MGFVRKVGDGSGGLTGDGDRSLIIGEYRRGGGVLVVESSLRARKSNQLISRQAE